MTSSVFSLEVDADGRFRYAKLPLYWTEPEKRFAFLIHVGEQIAGCALVTRGSPVADDPDVFDVAEFFVLRAHRRTTVGSQAACALWDQIPGSWTVRVVDANDVGLAFWSSTIDRYTSGRFSVSQREGRPHSWNVFAFDSRDVAAPPTANA